MSRARLDELADSLTAFAIRTVPDSSSDAAISVALNALGAAAVSRGAGVPYAGAAPRLLLIAGKTNEAGKQIDAISHPHFPAIANELRGDIAAAQGQREQARKAYQLALTTLDQAAPTRNLLELKLIDVGGQPPTKPEI